MAKKKQGQKEVDPQVLTRAQKRQKASEDDTREDGYQNDMEVESVGLTSEEDDTEKESEEEETLSDDETVIGGSAGRTPKTVSTRCTLKLQVVGGKDPFGRAVGLVKEFLTQLQTFDKWAHITPWYDNVPDHITDINLPSEVPSDPNAVISYFPRFMNRKPKKTKHDEYVSIKIGHLVELEELALDLGTWLRKGGHALYIDMLQAERKREAGIIINSYFTMDLMVIRDMIEKAIGCKVGLRWKPIAGTFINGGDPVRAIHVEVDATYDHQGLRKLSEIFGKGTTGFQDGRKMRFFASMKNAKSATTRAAIKKAVKRQRFFESTVKKDYFSDVLHLDVIPRNSPLPTMREMITKIRSQQFPHLQLIHSVDETWQKVLYKGDYTYLVMPHLEEEAELMMHNLLPYMRHVYGDDVLPYFTSTVKEIAKDDRWDPIENRVICAIDTNAELEDEDDSLGFTEAKKFLESKQSQATTTKSSDEPTRPALRHEAQKNLEIQKTAAEKVNAMTNAAEAAYYKDDDSISTLGSLGTELPLTTGTNYATRSTSHAQSTSSATVNIEDDQSHLQEMHSVASSITMESFATLQKQVNQQDARMIHINQLLEKMAEVVLKGDRISQSMSSQKDGEARGSNSSGSGL